MNTGDLSFTISAWYFHTLKLCYTGFRVGKPLPHIKGSERFKTFPERIHKIFAVER